MNNPGKVHSKPGQTTDYAALIRGCTANLEECELLLSTLSVQVYCDASQSNSSVGAHVRHIFDRFQCFLSGIARGHIDYDARKRDKLIETSLEASAFTLASVRRRILELDPAEIAGGTLLVSEAVHRDAEAVTAASCIERELMGLISHSTHHLAIIGLIVKALGIETAPEFGKAASTRQYEGS